jgi:lysyl-tRNA synthetase class II
VYANAMTPSLRLDANFYRQTNARMIDKLVGEFIEEGCINPTFIVSIPRVSVVR